MIAIESTGERLRAVRVSPILAGMLQSGYLQIGRWRGVPIRIHLLTPLGALVFTGFRFAPGAWVGFLLLVLLHEMGHALLVMRYRLRVSSIELHAYGGLCRWSGQATDWERAVIAWGGVIAQATLGAVTVGLVAVFGYPRDMFARELVEVFTRTNLWLMLINLAPFPPLDGAEAWKIVGELRRRWSSPKLSPEDARRIAKAFEDAVRKRP
jgi:stage IV sporulation protein FB